MTKRINRGETVQKAEEFPVSSAVLVGIILFFSITVIVMLITMLKMSMRRGKRRGSTS